MFIDYFLPPIDFFAEAHAIFIKELLEYAGTLIWTLETVCNWDFNSSIILSRDNSLSFLKSEPCAMSYCAKNMEGDFSVNSDSNLLRQELRKSREP